MPNAMNLSPMPRETGNGKLVGTIGAAAAALLVSTVALWEGKSNDPYRDIVGVMTVCYGETNVQMRRYSNAECQDMLANSLAGYSKAVLERNPELRTRPNQLAASSSLAYNIGPSAYNRSTVAKRFSAGRFREACDSFLAWRFAGGKEVRGLSNRRKAERDICLRGL